jgi:hypothetical protein
MMAILSEIAGRLSSLKKSQTPLTVKRSGELRNRRGSTLLGLLLFVVLFALAFYGFVRFLGLLSVSAVGDGVGAEDAPNGAVQDGVNFGRKQGLQGVVGLEECEEEKGSPCSLLQSVAERAGVADDKADYAESDGFYHLLLFLPLPSEERDDGVVGNACGYDAYQVSLALLIYEVNPAPRIAPETADIYESELGSRGKAWKQVGHPYLLRGEDREDFAFALKVRKGGAVDIGVVEENRMPITATTRAPAFTFTAVGGSTLAVLEKDRMAMSLYTFCK